MIFWFCLFSSLPTPYNVVPLVDTHSYMCFFKAIFDVKYVPLNMLVFARVLFWTVQVVNSSMILLSDYIIPL